MADGTPPVAKARATKRAPVDIPAETPIVAKTRPVAKKPAPARVRPPEAAALVTSQPIAAVSANPIKEPATMETIDTVTTKAQTMFADANTRAKGAMEKGAKLFEELNAFGKGNIEAIVESSKIAAKGVETMSQDAAAFAKKSFEEATAAAKSLATVTSPTEFLKLQGDYARSYFDGLVAHNSRSTEAMLKLTGEIVQPISNRFALAAEKVKVAA